MKSFVTSGLTNLQFGVFMQKLKKMKETPNICMKNLLNFDTKIFLLTVCIINNPSSLPLDVYRLH